jgi:predicted MFS family arabinose efflux permease
LSHDNALLALSALLFGASFGFYQYVLPLFIASLGADPDQVGLALAIGNGGSVVGLLVGGVIVNAVGYRPQMIASWVVTVIATGLFVIARSWEMAALALLLTTLSLFAIPAFNAYIVLARDGQEAAEALTVVYVGFTAGQVLTPALGGWIIAASGMPAMFLASLACIVGSTLAVALVRDRASDASSPAPPLEPSRTRRQRAISPLLVYRAPLANRALRQLLMILVASYTATYVAISLLPNYLHDRLGVESSTVGVFGTGAALVGVIASLVLTRRARGRSLYPPLAASQLLLVGGFALELLAPALGGIAFAASALGFAARGGLQAQQALARAMVASVAKDRTIGPAFALQSLVFNATMALGPALAGILYTVDPALPLWFGLAVGAPLTILLIARAND